MALFYKKSQSAVVDSSSLVVVSALVCRGAVELNSV